MPALAAIWLVAQLGPDGVSDRCWILRGVTVKVHQTSENYWLSQADQLDGWMQRVEVKNDTPAALAEAAKSVGISDPSRCNR